ncbi:UNVERIFIED_CONTAM: hypothetical protein HDU68_009807 [Siphonaria sp. JEL0065]|nr:hypothetical protein HDU68_009807 [Siphonaria sp. JEL0065]
MPNNQTIAISLASAGVLALVYTAWSSSPSKNASKTPHGYPIIGHIATIIQGPQKYLISLFEGTTSNIVEASVFGFRIYIVRGQEYVRKILTSSQLNTRHANPEALQELKSNERGLLLNSNIPSWKRLRKILVESVGKARFLSGLAPKINQYMIPVCELLDKLDNNTESGSGNGTPILANVFFGSISLDVIFDVIFTDNRRAAEGYLSTLSGVQVKENEESDVLLNHVHKVMEATLFFVLTPVVLYKYVSGFIGKAQEHRRSVEEWDLYVKGLITQKKEQISKNGEEEETEDLATILIQECEGSGNSEMWVQEALGLVKETIAGGTDTSSNTMCFLTFELARNPHFADKIHEEIVEVVGAEELTSENVEKLEFLEAAIHETTRLYAVAQMTQRAVNQDFTLGEYTLKKDSAVFVSIQPNHHSPEFWESPLKFDPTRFLESNSKDLGGPMGFGFAHLPFGHGIRKCPGEALALKEMKLVMANLIRRYSFVLADPSKPLQIKDSLTLECQDLPIYFKRR